MEESTGEAKVMLRLKKKVFDLKQERDLLNEKISNDKTMHSQLDRELTHLRIEQQRKITEADEKEKKIIRFETIIQESESALAQLIDNSCKLEMALDNELSTLE